MINYLWRLPHAISHLFNHFCRQVVINNLPPSLHVSSLNQWMEMLIDRFFKNVVQSTFVKEVGCVPSTEEQLSDRVMYNIYMCVFLCVCVCGNQSTMNQIDGISRWWTKPHNNTRRVKHIKTARKSTFWIEEWRETKDNSYQKYKVKNQILSRRLGDKKQWYSL